MVAAAIFLASCSSPTPEAPPPKDGSAAFAHMEAPVPIAPVGPSAASIEAAKAAIKSEPKVKDMIYQADEAVQWQVGVLDDGSKRIGYAEYICSLLREHEALSGQTHVRIVDIAKVTQGDDFRSASLGHVICETGDVVAP